EDLVRETASRGRTRGDDLGRFPMDTGGRSRLRTWRRLDRVPSEREKPSLSYVERRTPAANRTDWVWVIDQRGRLGRGAAAAAAALLALAMGSSTSQASVA